MHRAYFYFIPHISIFIYGADIGLGLSMRSRIYDSGATVGSRQNGLEYNYGW